MSYEMERGHLKKEEGGWYERKSEVCFLNIKLLYLKEQDQTLGTAHCSSDMESLKEEVGKGGRKRSGREGHSGSHKEKLVWEEVGWES